MARHKLTLEERIKGRALAVNRPMDRVYTEKARLLAEMELETQIALAKAEAKTAPLFRWWPADA